jgi:hypothetical protein
MIAFRFTILQYVHSSFLDERINVGILFHFTDHDLFIFKYPEKFKRIKDLYGDFQEWQLKLNLKALDESVHNLNNEGQIITALRESPKDVAEILRTDETVLRFSETKTAVIESADPKAIANSYFNLYFSEFKSDAKRVKHDEEYLLRSFKQKLIFKNASAQNLLKRDTVIGNSKTSIKFDYEWHNGRANLIKPISFDLEDESSINHKAILLHGQLNFLSNELSNKQFHIDLLVSPPINGSKKLFSAYQNAVNILKETTTDKEIIEESRLENYVDHVAKKIHAPVFFNTIRWSNPDPNLLNIPKQLPPKKEDDYEY